MADKIRSLSDFDADEDLFNQTDSEEQEDKDQEETEVVDKKKKPTKKVEEDSLEEEEEAKPEKKEKKEKKEKVETPEDSTLETEDEEEQESEQDAPDATKFFEEVGKLTGYDLDVEYGDVDPLSPQGVAIREKAVREAVLDDFLLEIEEKYPQAYKVLQHSYNGGNVAELFSQTTSRDYSTVELKEGDDNLAKEILKEYYKSRGVKNEAKITKMIEADEDSEGGLLSEAKSALEELKSEQETKRNEVIEAQKQKAAEQKKKDSILVASVDEVLETRKLGSFKISDNTEAREFKKFVLSGIRKTADGKYEFASPIDQNNIEKLLQYEYFKFKKGDLSKIIQQKATTENTEKLSLRLKTEQQKTKKGTTEQQVSKRTLQDF